jgi:Collagen triple helix repeat (20 copies)
MRLKGCGVMRPFALTAIASMMAMVVVLGWGGVAEATMGNFSCEGTGSLESATGTNNLACGYQALHFDTTGYENVAVGAYALLLNTEGHQNVASGSGALSHNTTGEVNTATGAYALSGNSTGFENTATGAYALNENTTGRGNAAAGAYALGKSATADHNSAFGTFALFRDTTGSENTATGFEALEADTTGSSNVAIGSGAGRNLTTGSKNIEIANPGVADESSAIRVGQEGAQTTAFMAGIYPTHLTGCFVQVTSTGELGCNPTAPEGKEGNEGKEGKEGKAGAEGKEGKQGEKGEQGKEGPAGKEGKEGPAGSSAVATFASFRRVPTGNCLNYTMLTGPGNGSCPSATTDFSSSPLLAGMPANGGKVSNLYAETNSALTGEETATVSVIDNTSGVTLLTCGIESVSKGVCSNTAAATVAAAAGDRLEVKITRRSPTCGRIGRCNTKEWQVRFRY